MKEINYQFRQRFSIVHRSDRRDFDKNCPDGFVEVNGGWCITIPKNADAVLMNAARDLEDYFFTSMKISLRVVREDEAGDYKKKIIYGVDNSIKEHSYRFKVSENEIVLCGQNSRMAAQAGYFLEDLMNLEEGPFVEAQDIVRTSLFNPRMVHSGYGLDMYPTEHLLNIAHSGISSILVFVNDVDKTPHGYEDFNDLCYRASNYGIDVYAYSYLQNLKHPDDEGAYEFYENLYGGFVDRCPEFKGMIFVGESCEFPSKDPNTTGLRRRDNIDENGNKKIKDKFSPGWYPCYDYKDLMEMIGGILKKRNPDFDIVFWSYNWARTPADARKALVDTLPKYITLQATFEMGEYIIRDGIKNLTVDYTLFSHGPGYYFSTEARFAKENRLRFYSMTNTGGLTWDIGVIPYIPAPYQWMKRYAEMRHAHTTYGLRGTMDSHHFGFSPSFISDLAKWAFHAPYVDLDEALRKIVKRDFSAEVEDAVCEAFRCFSDGTYHHISTPFDQYGPCRIGPSYPFILFENQNVKIPTVPYAHFGGNSITYPVYGKSKYRQGFLVDDEEKKRYDYEIYSFRIAEELYTKGCEILKTAIEKIPERKKENAYRILALCLFYRNTLRTAINVKEFAKRKDILLESHGEERNRLVDEMTKLCKAEINNAEDTIHLVEFDSRLGYEPSMEYMCDRAHIEWKLGLLREVTEKELPSYYEN